MQTNNEAIKNERNNSCKERNNALSLKLKIYEAFMNENFSIIRVNLS